MSRFCLQCDDGTELVLTNRHLPVSVPGMNDVVPDVHGWHCPKCRECEFVPGENEGERVSRAMDALFDRARKMESEQVRAIRKRLGLTQTKAANIFGGGVNAFSEYERGKTQPHKSTLLLLKLLDQHPELLDEIRAA